MFLIIGQEPDSADPHYKNKGRVHSQYSSAQNSTICMTLQNSTVHTVQCITIQYRTVLYSTVQFSSAHNSKYRTDQLNKQNKTVQCYSNCKRVDKL